MPGLGVVANGAHRAAESRHEVIIEADSTACAGAQASAVAGRSSGSSRTGELAPEGGGSCLAGSARVPRLTTCRLGPNGSGCAPMCCPPDDQNAYACTSCLESTLEANRKAAPALTSIPKCLLCSGYHRDVRLWIGNTSSLSTDLDNIGPSRYGTQRERGAEC